jgi:hypothetical protein
MLWARRFTAWRARFLAEAMLAMEVFLAPEAAEKGAMVLSLQGVCNSIVQVPTENRCGHLPGNLYNLSAGPAGWLSYNPAQSRFHLIRK